MPTTDKIRRDRRCEVRLTLDEYRRLRRLASGQNLSLSELIRRVVMGYRINSQVDVSSVQDLRKVNGDRRGWETS